MFTALDLSPLALILTLLPGLPREWFLGLTRGGIFTLSPVLRSPLTCHALPLVRCLAAHIPRCFEGSVPFLHASLTLLAVTLTNMCPPRFYFLPLAHSFAQ